MIKQNSNPWENMPVSTSRRVDSEMNYDFFWITDLQGRFGIYFKSKVQIDELLIDVSLKGIDVIKRIAESNFGELFLVVKSNEDWPMFLTLCEDVLNVCTKHKKEKPLIKAIQNHLLRWQKFLSQNNALSMPLANQMGLFAELSCLIEYVIPSNTIHASILAWVGPDFDKQDFSLNELSIEVKSYISSKGSIVKISSLHQLDYSLKKLILLAYGVTLTQKGNTIPDLIKEIKGLIENDENNTLELFYWKLAEYGFLDYQTKDSFFRFNIDKVTAYGVSEYFPTILSKDVRNEIVSVKYSIDLSKCQDFEINLKTIL
jgi:hypothetical protein